MKLTLTHGESQHQVAFDEAYGQRKLELDGQELNLSLLRTGGCRVRFTVDGRPVEALITGSLPDLLVDAGCGPLSIQVEESRFAEVRRISGLTTRVRTVSDFKAPMPGLITRVLVAVGETVSAGTPLLIMEAMKMENELRSPAPGKIQKICARPGLAVEVGAVLVVFEAPGSQPSEPKA
jgi:biotin carboxyl carrier protein